MNEQIAWWPILALGIFVVFVILVIVLVVAAVKSPQTRNVLLVLLGVGGALFLLGVPVSFFYLSMARVNSRVEQPLRERISSGQREVEDIRQEIRLITGRTVNRPSTGGVSVKETVSVVDEHGKAAPAAVGGSGEPQRYHADRFPGHVGVKRVEAPDDRAVWEREGEYLEFTSGGKVPSWMQERSRSRVIDRVGDTEFVYWPANPTHGPVGYSTQNPSAGEAFSEARASAQDKLAVLALRHLKQQKHNVDVTRLRPLARYLAANEFSDVREYHSQSALLPISGYEVHRRAVLLAAEPGRIVELSGHITRKLEEGWIRKQEIRKKVIWAVGTGILAAFVIFLLYSVFNASTKGHFAWPLRIVSISILCALALAVYYMLSKVGFAQC